MMFLLLQGPRRFQLRYRVFDDKFDNATTIVINVGDVNDHPPRFGEDVYEVTDVVEEVQVPRSDVSNTILRVSHGNNFEPN